MPKKYYVVSIHPSYDVQIEFTSYDKQAVFNFIKEQEKFGTGGPGEYHVARRYKNKTK